MIKKKKKTEKVWCTGLTKEDMNNISKKKSRKKTLKLWSDEYSDVDRFTKKPKKFKRNKTSG